MDVYFKVCGGYTVKFSSCSQDGGSVSDYNYNALRLYNAAGTQLAAGGRDITGYSCWTNGGAWLTYAFTGACQTFVLKQGCSGGDACTAAVALVVTGAASRRRFHAQSVRRLLPALIV